MSSKYIYLHGTKCRMRYDPEKIVYHGYKLYIKAWCPFMSNEIFVVQKDFIIECVICRYKFDSNLIPCKLFHFYGWCSYKEVDTVLFDISHVTK